MLTSAQILLVLTLFSLLLFVSHGKESLEVNTTQNIEEGLRNMAAEYIPFKSEENFNLSKEKGENSNPKASNFSLLDSPNKSNGTTDFVPNLTTDFSRSTRPTPIFSESPPLIHGFVSRLPWNSSAANENSLSVSAPPNATSAVTSEEFTGSLADDDMDTDNSSLTVSIPPSAPTTVSVSTATPEPDGWLTTVSDGVAGFTPYQETTLQPTVQFTNDSKIFSNTSDPQEENRNTGVVFGAMLGAILGASLLTLVGYLLCGRRKTNSFSHRRLYDDRNEPVLRLDNAPEPYDVNLGNVSYYNPTMNDSSMPAGRENARDGIPMDDIPPVRTSV